jgi:hypothetical protein
MIIYSQLYNDSAKQLQYITMREKIDSYRNNQAPVREENKHKVFYQATFQPVSQKG